MKAKMNGPGVSPALAVPRGMAVQDFAEFLFSPHLNSAWKPDSRTVHQDMTLPLPNYLCYSSHNTYLTGHQLKGASSPD